MKKMSKKSIGLVLAIALMAGGLSLVNTPLAHARIAMGDIIYHTQIGQHDGFCVDDYVVIPILNNQGEVVCYITTHVSCRPFNPSNR